MSDNPLNAPARPTSERAGVQVRHLLIPALVWLGIAVYSVAAAAPATVIGLPGLAASRTDIAQVLPQGWAFFTKSQRDPMVDFYTIEDGEPKRQMLLPSSRWENAFGASRRGRSEGVEVALLSHAVTPSEWRQCASSQLRACLLEHQGGPAKSITNATPAARLCGAGFLVETEPVAWSYRNLTEDTVRANSVAVVEVTC